MRTQPSHYPPLAFHVIRTGALVSSLVVSAVLSYFVYHLKHDNFKIPWTFLVVSFWLPASCPDCPILTSVLAFRSRASLAHHPHPNTGSTFLPCTLTAPQLDHQHPASHSMDPWPVLTGLEYGRHIGTRLQHCQLGLRSWNHGLPSLQDVIHIHAVGCHLCSGNGRFGLQSPQKPDQSWKVQPNA